MVKLIAKVHGKRIVFTKLFNPIISLLKIRMINKIFGDLIYEMSISTNINEISFSESILKTEK